CARRGHYYGSYYYAMDYW
nr:immunoglobulin heavy chain junction region [Mus musculus]